ncbi:S-adenosyl-L-methionine-dependent methyltransferase [Obba rivulosa]|uniref:Trimethylguanosine synthase n=1 Tax=Obba rivulosa TaxID=1052685 RepID=A0A8E2J6X8_9APHY|nr:S-adenosyl-L-methionine-dependent methyltransferase [Obba rivulosa]
MGRKQSNLSGLARFVQALKQPSDSDAPVQQTDHTVSTSVTILPIQSDNSTAVNETGKRPSEAASPERPPAKKRKVGLLKPELSKYDAAGLVPFYTEPSQVPSHLRKYFFQRERYFSKYSEGCLLDEEGWYSVTPERIADQIAERCRCDVVLDAFCGVGGNAIAFARTCERVIALDTSPVRLALARHNAAIYGVEGRIEFILADFLSFARALLRPPSSEAHKYLPGQAADSASEARPSRKIDVVFLSPPWGGPSYLTDASPEEGGAAGDPQAALEYSLASIRPIHGAQLFKLARRITRNVAYFLPRNTRLEEVAALVDGAERDEEQSVEEILEGREDAGGAAERKEKEREMGGEKGTMEMVEVEEEWMGSKLKALTCYFGGLVQGQEDQFYA